MFAVAEALTRYCLANIAEKGFTSCQSSSGLGQHVIVAQLNDNIDIGVSNPETVEINTITSTAR